MNGERSSRSAVHTRTIVGTWAHVIVPIAEYDQAHAHGSAADCVSVSPCAQIEPVRGRSQAPGTHDERASPRPAHERAAQATRGVNSAVATGAGNAPLCFPPNPSGAGGKNIPGNILAETMEGCR